MATRRSEQSEPEAGGQVAQETDERRRLVEVRQVAVKQEGVEAVECGQRDQRPAREAQPAFGRPGCAQPAEERQECERAQEAQKDAAHARFERKLLPTHEHGVGGPLRRDAIQQSSKEVYALVIGLGGGLQAAVSQKGRTFLVSRRSSAALWV